MNTHKIVFTDYYYPNIDLELEVLRRLDNVEIVDCTKIIDGGVKDEAQVIRYASDADAIIVQFARMTKKVIENLTNCKIISRYAIGVDTIDIKAAQEKGIVVSNVPDYCIEEVSDTAIAHILNCVRKITEANNLLYSGNWSYQKIKPIRRFGSLVVGLIAFGNIARRVAEKLQPFGNRILAYDPYFRENDLFPWVSFMSLEELLSQSDVVSIHAPLTVETHHLINKENISLIKNGAIIVNTSRGGLIDENALAKSIEDKQISSVGLDVLDYPDDEYEKSVLLKYPEKAFITPHMGWYSENSINDLQLKTALNVFEMLKNGQPLYHV